MNRSRCGRFSSTEGNALRSTVPLAVGPRRGPTRGSSRVRRARLESVIIVVADNELESTGLVGADVEHAVSEAQGGDGCEEDASTIVLDDPVHLLGGGGAPHGEGGTVAAAADAQARDLRGGSRARNLPHRFVCLVGEGEHRSHPFLGWWPSFVCQLAET